MYSKNGDVVCKGCFYTADALQRQLDGARQLIFGGIFSIVAAILCTPFVIVSRKLFALLFGTLVVGGVSFIRYGAQSLKSARRQLSFQPR
jgi:hypothetical protein